MNIEKVDENTYRVQSHTNKDTWYVVNIKTKSCTCLNYKYRVRGTGGCCKHYIDLIKYIEQKLKDNEEVYFQVEKFIKAKNNYALWEDVVVEFDERLIDDMILFNKLIERRGYLMVM